MSLKRQGFGRHTRSAAKLRSRAGSFGLVVLVGFSLCCTLALLSWKNEVFSTMAAVPGSSPEEDLVDAAGALDAIQPSNHVEAVSEREEREREQLGGGDETEAEVERSNSNGASDGNRRERASHSSSSSRRGRNPRPRDRGPASSSSGSSSSSGGRRRRRDKENINKEAVDFGKISNEILSQLSIPETEPYRHKFPDGTRLVVNKQNPNNRLAHTQQEKSVANLPAKDIEERWGSCAVVGNSGLSLFNEKQGQAIDRHDVVIRFNDGPTAGFEKYVGTKTSFRFINNNWSRVYTRRQPRGCSEEALMLFGNGAVRFLHSLNTRYSDKHIYFMAPEFALNARGTYKKAYAVMDESGYIRVKGRNSPPTGIEGIFFGLEVCDTVDLYGFQIANDPKIKYHYHNEVKGVEAAHSFGFQYEFLKVLMHGGFINVCLPETDSGSCLTGKKEEASGV